MTWPQITVESWEHFLGISAEALDPLAYRLRFLFRGQAAAEWRLTPALHRYLPAGANSATAIDIENLLETEFRTRAHLHLPASHLPTGDSALDWWVVMQHYGAPTRLLDWSESIFVAAYFACERLWEVDGAIWLFDVSELASRYRHWEQGKSATAWFKLPADALKDPAAAPEVLPWASMRRTDRMVAQQGHFSVSTNVLGDHQALLDAALRPRQDVSDDNTIYLKVVIPAALKPILLRGLRSVNVTAHSLFPGLDGLGRSLSELALLGCAFPLPFHRPKLS